MLMPETKKGEKALNMLIPEDWHDWLRDEAHKRRTSIAEMVRSAIAAKYPEVQAPEEKPAS